MPTLDFDLADLAFLTQLAADVVDASRVSPGQKISDAPTNSHRFPLIRPGGRACYPAYWVRDFTMSLGSGLIGTDEVRNHLRLTAQRQNGAQERRLKSGGIVPAFAIPDHINFDGQPVFYPGTMSPGEDQGGEPFGVLPPADDHYYFISAAFYLWSKTNDAAFLREEIEGLALIERLLRAFAVPESDPSTGGMFATSLKQRAVGFGFCDTVHLSGSILFPSLLRYQAAQQLSALCRACSQGQEADQLRKVAAAIASHVVPVFGEPGGKHGWLLAATETGRQPDVWGTLYALHLDVLPEEFAKRARHTIADAVSRRTITSLGAVRHVPTDYDASSTSAWEKVAPGFKIGAYQNGGYWHTPTGWLIEAMGKDHGDVAAKIWQQYIAQLREHDFRKGASEGAPFECFSKDGASPLNPVYMTSVTVPLATVRKLGLNEERSR
jgi:hypothetical protein